MSEKKEMAVVNNKKTIFKILLFLSIIMTSIGIFFASYYSSINKVYDSYESTLATNINGINEVNNNIAQFNSNQTIDVKYAKAQLPTIINELSKYKNNLASSVPTVKYKKDHENLKSGLDNNILIYRQALAILMNPHGPDVNVFWENLKTYRNDCMNFYSLIDINNIKIDLPQTSLTFIDNVLADSYNSTMEQKEATIKSQKVEEFTGKVDELSKSLTDVKINYYSYVLKIRKNEMSYDEVLKLVEDNFIQLSNVKASFKSLSIPPTAIPTYEAFKPLPDMYENYLMDFKLALTNEKIQALSAVVDPTTADALYTASNVNFGEVERFYNIFNKIFMELKNK